MVCFVVVVFDFGIGAVIFIMSLVAPPRTRRHCFTASVTCMPIFKTFLAAHWPFIIFVSFGFCLFFRKFLRISVVRLR